MITFKWKRKYPGDMDPEMIKLCDALNCLPGIETNGSCCGHDNSAVNVFFKVTDPEGIFFLARCVSRRYWKYGHTWSIYIPDVSDRVPEASYVLESNSKGDQAYEEMASLVKNIVHHLNHKNFLEGFSVNMSRFDVVGEPLGDDWWEVIKDIDVLLV